MSDDDDLYQRLFSRCVWLENGCLEWQGAVNSAGYGQIIWHGKSLLTHRVAFDLCIADLPPDAFVCHTCIDSRRCCNPAHLFLGDSQINVGHMIAQDRHAYGERKSDRTEDEVREIHRLAWAGEYTALEIARMFGCSGSNVHNIKHERIWKHLWEETPWGA
jgi:HNH endonuclease